MLEVQANNVGPIGTQFQQVNIINPFNESQYYHPYCPMDNYNDWTILNCWLAYSLADLNQTNAFTRSHLLNWIAWLIQTYNIDGLKIDTCEYVPKDFWAEFSRISGVYTMCEVFDGSISHNAEYQDVVDATLNYPMFYLIRDLFQSGYSMLDAKGYMNQAASTFKNMYLEGSFVDNSDNARFLYNYPKINRFMNALAWSLTWPGIPIVYYGSEQGFNGGNDPQNREVL